MKLSIVIPFYRYANYLKECLQSLKDSTFQDFEVLLVLDEKSEDASVCIHAFEKDLALKVIQSPAHGVAHARNIGIKEASGEYIYFLDSDDYVLDDTFANLSQALNGEDIVAGNIEYTWNNKANFLEKRAKKLEEIDEEEIEEKDARREARVENFVEKYHMVERQKALAYYYLFTRRKGMMKLSVDGSAYKRSFLIDHNLTFDEDCVYCLKKTPR